ncbi:MAG TPA: hypothetical protein VG651_16540 [Stellaceae bacterium]|nr:hypothetical protein [Stellaceae bacterium]
MPSDDRPPTGPASVYADDTTLCDLCTAELFVVTVLRLWRSGANDPDRPEYWARAFRAAGIATGGAPAFGSLMRVVAGAARHPLDVRPRACRRLGRDEDLLLRLISMLQGDRRGEASRLLDVWLPPAAAGLATRPAEALAMALAGVGLVVPLRHAEAAALSRLAACAHATPGLALLQ